MKTYYTPDIKEFGIGFEFEMKTPDGWTPYVYGGDTPALGYMLPMTGDCEFTPHNTRVKYIDREAIESLGFTEGEEKVPYIGSYLILKDATIKKPTRSEVMDIHLVHQPLTNWVLIWQIMKLNIGDQTLTRFSGTIKNKFKLNQLLEDIGVVTDRMIIANAKEVQGKLNKSIPKFAGKKDEEVDKLFKNRGSGQGND